MYPKVRVKAGTLYDAIKKGPAAQAEVFGAPSYPSIHGLVSFYRFKDGVLVAAEISGLPYSTSPCQYGIFAFHIHTGSSCTGTEEDPFADTLGHYNPGGCGHPDHAGDLPPLFGNNGYAFSAVYTDRFSIDEIIGRTVIIHAMPDDFTTQPSGNSGRKIACGQIVRSG